MTGHATFWVKNVDGEVETEQTMQEGQAVQEKQVLIMHIITGDATIDVVFRRGEFSRLCANPNNADEAVEVAVNIEMEESE